MDRNKSECLRAELELLVGEFFGLLESVAPVNLAFGQLAALKVEVNLDVSSELLRVDEASNMDYFIDRKFSHYLWQD